MSWDKAVSYTHLDVYKRQGIKRGSRSCGSPIRRTMIRTLGCFWTGTAYMLGRDFPPCFPMAGTRLPLK